MIKLTIRNVTAFPSYAGVGRVTPWLRVVVSIISTVVPLKIKKYIYSPNRWKHQKLTNRLGNIIKENDKKCLHIIHARLLKRLLWIPLIFYFCCQITRWNIKDGNFKSFFYFELWQMADTQLLLLVFFVFFVFILFFFLWIKSGSFLEYWRVFAWWKL